MVVAGVVPLTARARHILARVVVVVVAMIFTLPHLPGVTRMWLALVALVVLVRQRQPGVLAVPQQFQVLLAAAGLVVVAAAVAPWAQLAPVVFQPEVMCP